MVKRAVLVVPFLLFHHTRACFFFICALPFVDLLPLLDICLFKYWSLFVKYGYAQLECDALAYRKVRKIWPSNKSRFRAQSQLRTLHQLRDNPKYLHYYVQRQSQSIHLLWLVNSQMALLLTLSTRWSKLSGNIFTIF